MRLPEFITSNLDAILIEWVAFARQQLPAASSMSDKSLLNHGRSLLEELVVNMGASQDELERQRKSEGTSTSASKSIDVASRVHGRQRHVSGFEIVQMVGEYRALRATVLRQWSSSRHDAQTQDIDDISRFNEAIDQALMESLEVFIAAVDRSRDLFLAVLGHDMRGPLGVISNSLAAHRNAYPDDLRRSTIMLRSVKHLKHMLDDLLEYTQRQLGSGIALKPETIQLEDFARNTLDEIAAVSPGRDLQLRANGDLEGEWDVQRMHQAMSNLVFNGLKYGYPTSAVTVELDGTRSDEVRLAVQNSGAPIPENLLSKLFDPLVRASEGEGNGESQVAGANLGLGLFVVREIARAHGGTVEVSSTEARTRFELRIPRFAPRQNK